MSERAGSFPRRSGRVRPSLLQLLIIPEGFPEVLLKELLQAGNAHDIYPAAGLERRMRVRKQDVVEFPFGFGRHVRNYGVESEVRRHPTQEIAQIRLRVREPVQARVLLRVFHRDKILVHHVHPSHGTGGGDGETERSVAASEIEHQIPLAEFRVRKKKLRTGVHLPGAEQSPGGMEGQPLSQEGRGEDDIPPQFLNFLSHASAPFPRASAKEPWKCLLHPWSRRTGCPPPPSWRDCA